MIFKCERKKNIILYIVLVIIAIMITMCNYISMKHHGYLHTDVAVWTNIAKGMEQGKTVYKDMFDHKGPILYFFYFLAYTLGNQFGIWMLDLVCNIITIFMIFLISNLILKDKCGIFIIIITCMLFMKNLCYENPCTESISLVFTLIAFYYGIKFILDTNTFKNKESIFTAICFSIVLLIRPNLVIFWVLFYISLCIKLYKEKKLKKIGEIVKYSILGASIVLIPVLFYFLKNNAFKDFIDCYLLFNIRYLGSEEKSLIPILLHFIHETDYIIVIVIVSSIYLGLINNRKKIEQDEIKLIKFSFIYYLVSFGLIIMPRRNYDHYLISMIPTLIVPLAITLKYMNSNKTKTLVLLILSCIFIAGVFKIQHYKSSFYNYMSSIEEIIKPAINFENSEDDVLVIGNRTSIYLFLDRQYNVKFFYQTPIVNINKEISDEVLNNILKNLPKFIVNPILKNKEAELTYFEQQISNILDEKYTALNEYVFEKID